MSFNHRFERVYIASDHAGLHLKQLIVKYLSDHFEVSVIDHGTHNTESCDYPDTAIHVVKSLENDSGGLGVLICGTGIGMSIFANRFTHIRAAVCSDPEIVRLARQHNDANVLCLAGRFTDADTAYDMIDAFIDTSFEAGRHLRRIYKTMYRHS